MGRCASECLYTSLQAPGTTVPLQSLFQGGRVGKRRQLATHAVNTHSPTRTTQTRSDCWTAVHTQLYRRHSREIERVVVTFNNCATTIQMLRTCAVRTRRDERFPPSAALRSRSGQSSVTSCKSVSVNTDKLEDKMLAALRTMSQTNQTTNQPSAGTLSLVNWRRVQTAT